MKKITVLLFALLQSSFAHSQDDPLIKTIQKLTLDNDSLQKQVLKPLQDSILKLSANNNAQVTKMQKQIDSLESNKIELNKKITSLQNENALLNKSSLKTERDSLKKQVELLTTNIAGLNKKNQEIILQVAEEKKIGEQRAKLEKDNGKKEILDSITNIYKRENFDELVKMSTKLSVQRDMHLIDSNTEVRPVLADLEKYFNVEELLAKKFDVATINSAELQLKQMNQKSTLLDELRDNIKFYKNFNDELKKTVEELVDLDRKNEAGRETAIQKLKLNDIITTLSAYIYNYSEFGNYPYLSDIVFEIIKRKQPNADADITDLLKKLQ